MSVVVLFNRVHVTILRTSTAAGKAVDFANCAFNIRSPCPRLPRIRRVPLPPSLVLRGRNAGLVAARCLAARRIFSTRLSLPLFSRAKP